VKVADDEQDSTYQNSDWTVVGSNNWPRTVREYDSIQKTLSPEKKDGWLVRTGKQKAIAINEKYRGNEREFWRRVNEKFTHSIPQMMFVSLPLVALMLQLLYFRQNKYYYVNHVVFTVNLYIAIYLLFLVFYGFAALFSTTGIRIFEVLATVTWIVIFFYIYKSLRNFYQQRRAKTILKFILFLLLFMTMISLLMGIYFLTSALQI
jgi:hypothetical protein